VFFGGVFYPLDALDGLVYTLSFLNPMVFTVDAVRYGVLDVAVVDPWLSLGVLAAATLVVFFVDVELVRRGYGLTE
jgi:ABC-2 type transport system permease protein